MSFTHWLSNRLGLSFRAASRRKPPAARRSIRLSLELLEDRTLLSSYTAATTSELIADITAANNAGGTNTITLAANTTFDLTAVNNATTGKKGLGANGLPVIKQGDNLTIIGNGDIIERSTAAGTAAFRLFQVAQGSSLTLQNVKLQNGLAQGSAGAPAADGGAFYNLGTLTVSGSTLSGNSAGGYGGAINNKGTLTVSGSSLSDNSAGSGGGINNEGMLTVSNSTLLRNAGDGIKNSGTATVSGSTLSYNSSHASGGGIVNFGGGTLALVGSTLSYNTAPNNGGGIHNTATLTISGGSTLSNNTAVGSSGGGIWSGGGTVTISGSSLLGNSAGAGGGIFIQGSRSTLAISGGCTISGNTASGYGGGIEVYSGTATISGCTLSGNSAVVAGGGIFINTYGTVTVKNSSSITGNTAPVGFGADVDNLGVLYEDISSNIGILDGNPAVPI